MGKYEQEFKNDNFIKPKPKEIERNDGRKSRPKLHPHQTVRSNRPRQLHKPVSRQAKSSYQNRLPRQTETPQHPMTKRMQRSITVHEKPRVFPHRTSRKSENSRKPTYAEIVRGSGRFTRRAIEGQTNTGYTKNSKRPAYFLESTHGGNYRPIATRKTTTMSTNLEGISTPALKPLNDQNRKDPKIIDLSSRDLTTNEIKLLKKGLKFTPTPETNKNELRNDIQEFG